MYKILDYIQSQDLINTMNMGKICTITSIKTITMTNAYGYLTISEHMILNSLPAAQNEI
jgi:hypothetical protein